MTDTSDGAAAGDPASAPIAGELLEQIAVKPSAEERRSDARGRIGNTALQTTLPGALVVLGTWAAALAGLDLDPGAGRDMPATVAAAFVTVLTIVVAWRMNRAGLNATDDDVLE